MKIDTAIIRNITTTHRSEIVDAIRDAEFNSFAEGNVWNVIVSTSGAVNVFPETSSGKLIYDWGDGFAEVSVYTADNRDIDIRDVMEPEETEEEAIRAMIENIDMEAELEAIEARIDTALSYIEQEF